jgi:hypothetical protein
LDSNDGNKNEMRYTILVISFIFLTSPRASACSCFSSWNDSFSRTAKNSEFVVLIKVLSFDEYLDGEIMGHEGKMPYSMTVEIIKKYKGKEQREKIKILGDNGILCRPYLSDFKINGYYLAAPIPIENKPNTEYEFFACRTDYLKVDISKNRAYGKYSLIRRRISLSSFENKLINGDKDYIFLGIIIFLLISTFIIRRNKKRNANNVYSA